MRYDRASAGKMSVQLNVLEHKDGVDVEKVLLRSYDDPSTVEMKKLWELAVGQGPAESTMKEAIGDLEVSHIVMDHFHTTEA